MVTTRKMNHYWNVRAFFTCLAFYVKESTEFEHEGNYIHNAFEIQVQSFGSGDLNTDKTQACPPDACPDDCPTINYLDENACKRCKCDWNLPCPDGYLQLGEGKQCIMISSMRDRRTWWDAKRTCDSKGGYLFHVKDPELLKTFLTSWSVEDNIWLGADELVKKEACPSGYTEIAGQCFQFSKDRASWYEAKSMCEEESAHLASLESDHWPLREYVVQYFRKRSFWLGARYDGIPEPRWKWVSGAPVNTSFPWGINDRGEQQYKGDRQDCMTLKYFPRQDEHEYVDNKCKKMKHYICQKRKVTLDCWRWTSGEKVSDSFPWGINDQGMQQYKGDKQKCMVARYFPNQKIHQYVDNRCFNRYRFICEADRCPKGYNLVGAQCLKVSTKELTWAEANEDCERKLAGHEDWNNHLLIVKDTTQFGNFITGLNTAENNYWVGAHNRGPKERCPFGYTIIGSQCFLMGQEEVSWDDAKVLCEQESAQLASLKEPDVLRDYTSKYNGKSSFWVGGRFYRNPDGWKWLSGASFNASFPWGINDRGVQQDKGLKQDCMILRYFPHQDEQEYADNRCKRKNYYICEKPKVRIDGWRWVSGEKLNPSFPWGENDGKSEEQRCMTLRFKTPAVYQYVTNKCLNKLHYVCEATRKDIDWTDSGEDDCTSEEDKEYFPCLVGYELFGEQCLKISKRKDVLSWRDAKAACVAQNGQLATVKDSELVKKLVNGLNSKKNFWLGADDLKETEQCPPGYIEVGSQCFLISNMKMNWNQAKDKCESLTAQLATVKEPMELRDHINRYYSTKSFWLGGKFFRDPGTEPSWKWVSGVAFNSSFPWGINDVGDQQYKGEKQDCMTLKYFPEQDEHEYVDNMCNHKKHYICEKTKIKLDGWHWITGVKMENSFPWGINDQGDQQAKGEKQHCMTLRYFPKQDIYHYVDNKCHQKYRYICETPRCPEGFKLVGQQCISISTEKLPWLYAKAKCDGLEQYGWQGQLLIVNDTEITKTQIENLNTQDNFWLGAIKFKQEICPERYVEIGSQCLLMSKTKMRWNKAQTACEKKSSQLASLEDPLALRNYVIKYFRKYSFWVGGRYHRKPDGWSWLSGAPFNNSFRWGINDHLQQQYKGEKQDCLILRYFPIQDEQEYVDNKCRKKNHFICSTPKVKIEDYRWVSGALVNSSFPWGINDEGTQQYAGEVQDCMTLRYFPLQKAYQYVDNRCEKTYRYVCEAVRLNNICVDNSESEADEDRTDKSASRAISSALQWFIKKYKKLVNNAS